MQGSTLKDVRRAFGVTQEQVAERLGVDPNTVSRWERGHNKRLCQTLLCAVVKNGLSGDSSRVKAYADAVIPAGLKYAVDHHPGLRHLFLEDNFVMIRASAHSIRLFPLMNMLMGVPYKPFIARRYADTFDRAFTLPREGLIAIKFYVHFDASVLKRHPTCYREYLVSKPYPHILDLSGRDISKDEHDAQPDVFVPVYA